MRRTTAVVVTTGFLLLGTGPASAVPPPQAALGGFTTTATATPLKVEVYEQAIPIPTAPQAELDFFYTRVEGVSGPLGSGRASALWPGGPVGEGFKTIGDGIGLPPELTKDGYPIQTRASSPGDPSSSAQEPFPGVVTRVTATPQHTVAKAGLNPAGDTEPKGDGDGEPSSPLPESDASTASLPATTAQQGGVTTASPGEAAPQPSPLGALAALVDAGTTKSVSRTNYGTETVDATATSALNDVAIAGGIVTIKSIKVSTRSWADLGAADSTATITYAGLEIGGQPFTLGKDGAVAGGQKVPIPGLSDDPAAALKALGIQITLPAPTEVKEGIHGAIDAAGLRVEIDTTVLRSKLPSLPMDQLIGGFPDSARQLKGLLLALNEAHPRVVVYLASAATNATAVPPVSFGSVNQPPATTPATTPAGTPTTPQAGSGTAVAPAPAAPGDAPGTGNPTVSTPIQKVSDTPGLPPLGSVPGMLLLGGILLGSGAGWWIRKGGMLLLGGASNCSHGLASGIPELRKA